MRINTGTIRHNIPLKIHDGLQKLDTTAFLPGWDRSDSSVLNLKQKYTDKRWKMAKQNRCPQHSLPH